ncbi:MAG: LysM peptidoglycan-binding domain-containing protein [Prevotellaceae bacterium]|jgi:LysM repeat protein|nr:LysM peptidoglycan-binding domain-containing protein [Prevotellaceae bacterium]
MKKLLIFCFLICVSVSVLAQNYQKKIVCGKEYYVYFVRQSEGCYAISKKFDVQQADIIEANPGCDCDKLKLGQLLFIPIKNSEQNSDNKQSNGVTIIDHKVIAKQTLWAISKMYGVPQQQILELNPNLDIVKIKIGQIIRVPVLDNKQTAANQEVKPQPQPETLVETPKVEPKPTKKFTTYEVTKKNKTIYGISKEFDVSINELLDANPFLEDKKLKIGDILQIPVKEEVAQNLPKEQTPPTAPVKTEEKSISKPKIRKRLKIACLLPFSNSSDQSVNTERFTEFYKGSLLALEEVKANGVSVEVQTFDTDVTNERLTVILADNFLADVDIIIGPAYPEQVSTVAAFAKKNKIAQIVPFTSKVDKADKHEQLYQFNPESADIFPFVIDEFIDNFSKNNIIFINFTDKNDKGSQFAADLKKSLKSKNLKFQEIQQGDNLTSLLSDKQNIIVLATSNYEEIASFAPYYKTLDASNTAFWLSDDIAKKFGDLPNVINYSLFDDNAVTDKYLQSYQKWFGYRNAKSSPSFDLIGYDLTYYFCMAQKEGTMLKYSYDVENVPFQQSSLKFLLQKNSKSFVNCGFFIKQDKK